MVYRRTSLPVIFAIVLFLMINCYTFPGSAQAEDNSFYLTRLHKLVKNGGYLVKKSGKTILSHNPDKLFIPASTWKVATSLAALKTLGPDYRFATSFYTDNQQNLYIKGNGDPFLISEEIDTIVENLKKKKINNINNIYLDDTSFATNSPPEGCSNSLNPYDVVNGGLAANFNTVNLTVFKNGTVQSAEDQTPTLPIMHDLAGGLPQGTHRINISIDPVNVLLHVGELFRAFQKKHAIAGSGKIIPQKVPEGLEPFYIHYSSKKFEQIIEGLMLYSNNYMTNQLYLALGANQFGYPATWEKGKKYLAAYLTDEFNFSPAEVAVAEGSGLSRANRITPRAMTKLLERFKPYAHLLPLDKGRRIKSGTLKGVYSYAGYFTNNDAYDTFVIILNQPGNHRDKVINLLEKLYKKTN